MPTPTLTLTLPRPHRAQRQILAEARRYNVAACGRRFGKTTLCLELATRPALAGLPVGYFAPAYKLLIEVWRAMVATLRPVARRINATERRIELLTGGVVEFWTLEDVDAGRSRRYARAIIDEAGLVHDLGARWQEAIRPTLADLTGDSWMLSTPKGRNFFWECWQRGQLGGDWASWQMPTEANPFIPPDEVATMRAELPALVVAQEIDAQFVEDALTLFSEADLAAAEVDALGETRPRPGRRYLTSVDVGRRRDATVINTFDLGGLPYQRVAFERLERVPYPQIQRRIEARQQAYGGALVIESNGVGDPLIENLEVHAEPFITTARTKVQALQALQLLLEHGQLKAAWEARERVALTRAAWNDDHTADEVMSLAIGALSIGALPAPGKPAAGGSRGQAAPPITRPGRTGGLRT